MTDDEHNVVSDADKWLEPFARVKTYGDLIRVLVGRRHELGLSQLDLDELAGWTQTYASKIEAKIRMLGPISLELALQTLGLELVVLHASLPPNVAAFVAERQKREEAEQRQAARRRKPGALITASVLDALDG